MSAGSEARAATVTDPLSEFGKTIAALRHSREQPKHVHDIINSNLHKEADEDRLFRAYSILSDRPRQLIIKVHSVSDCDLDYDLRHECCEALDALGKIFQPAAFMTDFVEAWRQNYSDGYMAAIRFTAPHVRKLYPLKVLLGQDISNCADRLSAGIQEISEQKDFPRWAATPLLEGAKELRFLLRNADFFGQDAALDALVALSTRASAIVRMQKAGTIVGCTIGALCTALIFVSDVVSAPKNIAEGLPWWQSTARGALDLTIPMLSSPPLQIEGPKEAFEDT